ncbi:MAG: hypothetical protein KKE91_03285 [Candidatus Omnitrophica bacterium]|nr:hypothetical protein [Candidatus Omnitrophota bacterium]
MKILKGILSESKDYYVDTKRKIKKKLVNLPKGSVKERNISGRKYYYLQERRGKRVVHKYLGRNKPEELLKQIKQRKLLKIELNKVNEALRIIKRSEGRKK